PQSKLGRSARLPAREVMILSIALGHPALIENRCEELAETEFMGAGVSALRDALLGAPVDALISSTALAEWLTGDGRVPAREVIVGRAAKRPSWWCRRPKAAPSDADQVLRQSLALHRRAGALD